MRKGDAREQILALLRVHTEAPLSEGEIAEALGPRAGAPKRLRKWLVELERDGEIVCSRGNRYAIGLAGDMVSGPIEIFRSGDGRVWDERRAESVFIPRRRTGTALPGDTVLVRIEAAPRQRRKPGARDEPQGRVINIVERVRHDLVGTLRSTGKFLYVVPLDPVYQHDLYVPDQGGAALGDRVVARFTSWENVHVSPEGDVIEVLGPADKPSMDTIAVMRHYGLNPAFADPVRREAAAASAAADTPGPRLDCRETVSMTIDPERARDYDDALSLERDAEGRRVLGVHIADVAHFVPAGGALDSEACRRGNSAYLPDAVVPMLPETLSNGICSLKPDTDRLVLSVFLTVDAAGQIVGRRFARAVIRSTRRLTYSRVMALLDGSDADAEPLPDAVADRLRALAELAAQLRRRRFAKHALDLDMPECELTLDGDGMITGVRVVRSDAAHQLVEECMVAANEAVALELHNRRVPGVHRVHDPPAQDRLDELQAVLAQMGYHPGDLSNPRHLAAFLRSVRGDAMAHAVQLAVLKSMNRAIYSATAIGHYGLAKRFYLHFTSPIRRYPDLVVHRQLRAALFPDGSQDTEVAGAAGEGVGGAYYDRRRLVAVAAHCSETERNAETAERTLVELKKLRYLAAQIEKRRPEVYDAVVVRVVPFGLFVELDTLQVQGLVHAGDLGPRGARFNRRAGALQAGKTAYSAGNRLQVHVVRVDMDQRQVDFAPA
jgi:ribonuclease R